MMNTTPQNHYGLDYQKEKFNRNHKKRDGLGKIRKKIESLLLKTRSPKRKTQSLVQKTIKIQIGAGKGILRGIFPQGSILTW